MLHIDAGTAVGVVVTSWPVCAAAVPYPSKTGAFKKMIVDGVLVSSGKGVGMPWMFHNFSMNK